MFLIPVDFLSEPEAFDARVLFEGWRGVATPALSHERQSVPAPGSRAVSVPQQRMGINTSGNQATYFLKGVIHGRGTPLGPRLRVPTKQAEIHNTLATALPLLH